MGCCSSRQVQEDVDMTHTAQTSGQLYEEPSHRIQNHVDMHSPPLPAAPVPEYTAHPATPAMTRDEKPSSPPPFGSTSGVALLSSPMQEDKVVTVDNNEKGSNDTPIIVRLSIARDIKVSIPSTAPFITVDKLRTRLFEHNDLNVSSDTHTIRFIHLGKILSNNTTIQPLEPDGKCKNTSETIFVSDGGIIQALVSRSA
ncbi:hypothetical protein INT43_000067 [Umbelopsis isabellina]|uniref:DSC E3 ubiquitin ligase complex subunit 3 ubiquitin-like domain-containing protein n=1 Tax=Mortierella isabellina TaxID=91625 RepID=A0A8H7PFH3_MORIS|nr:hypothetical protein INT43_000067 [Umbelopsis isabellina]